MQTSSTGFVHMELICSLTPPAGAIASRARVLATLETFTDVPAKPFVLTAGAHALNLERLHGIIDELPAWIAAY